MKLKTLKDLEKEHEKCTYEDSLVLADELKQEAIKWIKHHLSYHNKIRDTIANEFMNFFNVTEEELK